MMMVMIINGYTLDWS